MKKSLNGRKIETKKDGGCSVSGEGAEAGREVREAGEARREYYQVELTASHRHSGGSDQYSVVEDTGGEEPGLTLIDMTEPIPRCVNLSTILVQTSLSLSLSLLLPSLLSSSSPGVSTTLALTSSRISPDPG